MQVGDPTDIKLCIVIVSYNSKDYILECIRPLQELYEKRYLNAVVVDNHGSDGVEAMLVTECSWVTVKSAAGNPGFGHDCNVGFDHESSEYTLFLNPDAVIQTESILKLVDFLLYFEETDLCKRTSAAGYEIWANGLATAEHIGGASSKNTDVRFVDGCIAEHFYRSRFYFYKKHYSLYIAYVSKLFELVQIGFRTLAQTMLGLKDALSAIRNRIQAPFFSEPGWT